ncbi:MAG: ATP-binding protein [Chloroflexota bacterium]
MFRVQWPRGSGRVAADVRAANSQHTSRRRGRPTRAIVRRPRAIARSWPPASARPSAVPSAGSSGPSSAARPARVRSFEAAAAGVDLRAAIEGDLPILEIDPIRIREVLANPVANALRHTPAGGTITVAGAVEDGRWVRLEVGDTGRGIDPALLTHVFDRFVKGDESRGSGLGLAIARQLVLARGGEISADSTPGAGTTIRLRLPLTAG